MTGTEAGSDGPCEDSRSVGDPPLVQLGDYQVIEKVGRSRICQIYKGFEPALNRPVAIKVLLPELARDEACVARFQAEAAATGRVAHPNIVPVYAVGEDKGRYFFVMQWVAGQSLAERLSERPRLPWEEATTILKHCLAGLQAAHAQGLVHGDVDPDNILLERDTNRAMLIDFGAARVRPAATGETTARTDSEGVAYLTPEQADARPADEQSDLYSLGVTAYLMLSRPAPSPTEISSKSDAELAPGLPYGLRWAVPEVPEALARIVARMISSSRLDRYQSIDEVLAAIGALDDGDPVGASVAQSRCSPDLKAARFSGLPELSPIVAAWIDPTRWQAIKRWAWNRFLARAPQVIRNLQTTEQHVDFAVAEYQRRCDELARQVKEGEGIAEEFAARKESIVRAAGGTDPSAESIADLTEQEGRLQQQLADVRLRRDQVNAKRLALVNQRDLLQARLRSAQARAATAAPGRRKLTTVLLAVTVLVVSITVTYSIRLWYTGQGGPLIEAIRSTATRPDSTPTSELSPLPSLEPDLVPDLEPEPVFRATPVRFPGPPAMDLSVFPADAVRAFDGAPPPYVLRFSGKDCVEFDLSGIDWDWMSRSYSAVLAARLEVGDRPYRLMGNLDTRSSDPPKPGWAILLVPNNPNSTPTETGNDRLEDEARLALAYTTEDGHVNEVRGRPFRPGGRWWRITFSKTRDDEMITVKLGEAAYFQYYPHPDRMPTKRCHPRFWLGCPDFADEEFHGEIGGFALHRADLSTGPGLNLGRDTQILSSFSYSPDGQVLDFSGRGRHGKTVGCKWTRLPERALPSDSRQEPSPGKRFALVLGQGRVVELLGTREMVGLDSDFTAEMWVRGFDGTDHRVFLGNRIDETKLIEGFKIRKDIISITQPAPMRHVRGWDLTFDQAGMHPTGNQANCEFQIRFPWKPGSRGRIDAQPKVINTNRWHHLAFCNTPAGRQVYLDGEPLLDDERDRANDILRRWVRGPLNLVLGDMSNGVMREPNYVRAFRISSSRRYDERFVPPPEFSEDQYTLVLLDLSKASSSPFVPDASGNEHRALMVLSSWVEVDKIW